MLTLDHNIKLTDDVIRSPNLCELFSEADLRRIGDTVYDGFVRDKWSRHKWERRTSAAMDLAMQVQKDKSFPWVGCANIAFPLITIAALQFLLHRNPGFDSGPDETIKKDIAYSARDDDRIDYFLTKNIQIAVDASNSKPLIHFQHGLLHRQCVSFQLSSYVVDSRVDEDQKN